jgi:hypothetical protein
VVCWWQSYESINANVGMGKGLIPDWMTPQGQFYMQVRSGSFRALGARQMDIMVEGHVSTRRIMGEGGDMVELPLPLLRSCCVRQRFCRLVPLV